MWISALGKGVMYMDISSREEGVVCGYQILGRGLYVDINPWGRGLL